MRRALAPIAALLLAAAASPPDYSPELATRVFDRASSLVARSYWDAAMHGLDWQAVAARYRERAHAAKSSQDLYGVINEMLGLLGDSHVYAVDPAARHIDSAAEAGTASAGFGFAMWRNGPRWEVVALAPGGPAARAGVEIGWQLASIDGGPPDVERNRAAGEEATLVFRDDAGTLQPRRLVAVMIAPPVERRATMLPGGTVLLGLDAFDAGADRWVAGQLAAHPAAVILDLRENGGGEAETVARVAGHFFTSRETLLRQVGRRAIAAPVLGAGRSAYRGPVALLVGPRSASGAEALAAMFEESGRAVTVGERTAGALTGAEHFTLPDGGQLSVAVVDIRTPSGERLEGRGFTPRYFVHASLADLRAGRDPVLERAEAVLAGRGPAVR